jgi:hypothetical protein
MKKLLALILVAALVLGCAACGSSDTPSGGGGGNTPSADGGSDQGDDTPAPAPDSGSGGAAPTGAHAYPNCNEDGSINLDTIANYDPEYDYTQNTRFKVAYISSASGPLYQDAANSYESWCNTMNCQWMGFTSAEGDNDKYMTLLQQALDSGYEILILDADSTIFTTVAAVMDEYPETVWMAMMSPPRDQTEGEGVPVGGNVIHPSVGFSHYDAGWQQMIKLFEWMDETYPDADWSEVGCLALTYSLSPPLVERSTAGEDYWRQYAPAEAQDNFFLADCAAAGLSVQGAIDTCGPIVSTNTDIKYWLVQGNVDDWAQGATTVVEQAGLGETSCGVTFGGSGLQAQWDSGVQNCWRYALCTSTFLYAEPILGCCYAIANGWTNYEDIWPSWVNYNDCGGEGHTYSSLRLPTTWLTYDDYKQYYEWVDLYVGTDYYHYDDEVEVSIDDYTAIVTEIPPEYAPAS